jgi:hypothetical protein
MTTKRTLKRTLKAKKLRLPHGYELVARKKRTTKRRVTKKRK